MKMESYLTVTVSVMLLAVDFSLQKLYQSKMGTSFKAGITFNAFVGLLTAIIFFCINGFRMNISVYSLIMAAAMSSLCMAYSLIGFRILKKGNMAFYTLALMSGGMTVPYIFGIFFLNEDFSILRFAGLILILTSVIISNISREKTEKKLIPACIAVFLLNGFVSILSKLHQIPSGYEAVTEREFVILTGIIKAVLAFIILGIIYIKKKDIQTNRVISKTTVLTAAMSAVMSGTSYMLQLIGAVKLPASVLYPLITGGSIILSTLAGILIFKEKVSRRVLISVCVCFAGTCLFL